MACKMDDTWFDLKAYFLLSSKNPAPADTNYAGSIFLRAEPIKYNVAQFSSYTVLTFYYSYIAPNNKYRMPPLKLKISVLTDWDFFGYIPYSLHKTQT